MKKVLFVATITKHINTFHIPYLKWFKEQGYEVHVASKGNEPIEYCDKHFDVPFERFPLKTQNIKAYRQLKNIINENKYEIIHGHTPVGGVLTRLAARKARKKYNTKVIYTAHGFHFYKGAPLLNWIIYYPIEKYLAKYTDCIITINREDYELAKKKFRKAKDVKYVYGVGIQTRRFDIDISEIDKENLRQELKLKSNDIILTYVAELNDNKNQIFLIQSLKELIKENNKYKLLLVGEGANKEKYIEEMKKEKLGANLRILGKRTDVAKILSITDIYVASSIREGLGMNIIEAMYMNVPVIATNNRGHREIIKDGENGFLVNSNKELNVRIKELSKECIVREKIILKGKEDCKKYFLENTLKQMKEIYEEIVK